MIMKKTELIAKIAETENCSKADADKALNAVLKTMTAVLAEGGKIAITGFGTFEVREHPARKCKNPRTGEMMMTKPSKAVAFKAGKTLKDLLNPDEA